MYENSEAIISQKSSSQDVFPSQAELLQASEFPIFTPDTIKLVEKFSWTQLFDRLRGTHKPQSEWFQGTEKRVAAIIVSLNDVEIPAVLKLIRPYYLDRVDINYKERGKFHAHHKELGRETLIDEEKRLEMAYRSLTELLHLRSITPDHFPRPFGLYRNGRHVGIVTERVIGKSIAHGCTGPQFLDFDKTILSLIEQEIFLESDALAESNLIVGHTAENPANRIVLVDAEIAEKDTSSSLKKDLDKLEWRVQSLTYSYKYK